MTGDVDLDRLADYVGGALDGTPEAVAVAQLVATDPEWTRAHAALVAAEAFVRADLALLSGEPDPMPHDVLARLDAAFAAEPPLPEPATMDCRPRLSVLPGGRATPTRRTSRRRWRSLVGVAAAAVVVGIGAVSLAPKLTSDNAGSGASSTATDAKAKAWGAPTPGSDPASTYSAAGVKASGSDYTAETLAALGGASIAAPGVGPLKSESGPTVLEAPSPPAPGLTRVPDPLRRLTEPDARAACLKAIVAQYGGTATLLDYARYQGSPALIVLLEGARGVPGRKWVVAVGPKCGSGGATTDQRYSAPVG